MPKRGQMPPPSRAIDAAKSSLQHLSDQERMITSRLLPPEDPVEAVFRPPESLPHSYMPAPPPKAASVLSAPVSLRVPRALVDAHHACGRRGLVVGDCAQSKGKIPVLTVFF